MMNEDCKYTEDIINRWENSGEVTVEERCHLNRHLEACGECARKYGDLLPFIEIDATDRGAENDRESDVLRDIYSSAHRSGSPEHTQLTDSIMDKIGDRPPKKYGQENIYKFLAVAAAFVFAAVLVLKIALPGQGETEIASATNGVQVEVHFTLTAPEAESVALVGDFTEWELSKIRLKDSDQDGVWEANVKLKKNKVYLYNFVIDGEEWIVDPQSIVSVDDGFGGESSLLKL
jgi:hypothetical protein